MPKSSIKSKLPTVLFMVTHVHINNTGPYEHLTVSPVLCSSNGMKLTAFDPLPLPGERQVPDSSGVISLDMESGSKILLSRNLRGAGGMGANLFLELKFNSRDPFKSGQQVCVCVCVCVYVCVHVCMYISRDLFKSEQHVCVCMCVRACCMYV
jgi:hypothetical protein